MEMLACIEALKTLEEPSNVVLHSDSQLVIKCALGSGVEPSFRAGSIANPNGGEGVELL